MKISQTLRKPENWQDFESLCLLLWREEWKSEDIKKNGRNGQAQNGVDICGHRDGENEYSGIQCKCKPGNKALTTNEIDNEIDNAKAFKPALKRLVFATTSDKDAALEEHVRIKDEENRKNGLFTIDIKSWQDIVDMLERNKLVLNTYMDFVADDYAVTITFDDGHDEKVIRPKWSRVYYMEPAPKEEPVEAAPKPNYNASFGGLVSQLQHIAELADTFNRPVMATAKIVKGTMKTNHTYCHLRFMVVNQGRTPIDDYKIIFHFNNQDVRFVYDNVEKQMSFPEINYNLMRDITLDNGQGVTMYGKSIIPGDYVMSDDFYIHLPNETEEVNIYWRLLSRHYSEEGKLRLMVEKEYEEEVEYDKNKAGKTFVRDYIEIEDITD